jgi:hypothetical protein
MKKIITLLALTVSVGAFAQEKVILNSKEVRVNTDRAILVRTADTPKKVEVTFQVPMANSICEDYRTRIIPRMCIRTEQVRTGTRRECRDVVITPSNPNAPRGPRYNPPTRRECRDVPVYTTRQYRYDCSYTESYCARYGTNVSTESDKVKIRFDLPALAGSEEETFVVTAKQRTYDGSNVEYDIIPENESYDVKKKGILGYDSYVIEVK